MENTKRKSVALWRAGAIFFMILEVLLNLFGRYILMAAATHETLSLLSWVFTLLPTIFGILAMVCLLPIASNKSLYWALGLWMVPWSFCIVNIAAIVIIRMIYVYIYAMFFVNNIHRVSEKYRVWVRVMAIVCVVSCTRTLFEGIAFLSGMYEEVEYFYIAHSAFTYLFMVCQVFYIIAFIRYAMSELFDGSKPDRDEKVDFNPLNKYFIGGVLAVGVGFLLLWLIQSNVYDINNLI